MSWDDAVAVDWAPGTSLLKIAGAGESEAARFGEEMPLVEDEPEADLGRLRDGSLGNGEVIWVMMRRKE